MVPATPKPAVHLAYQGSRQLYLIFTGNAERLMMDPLHFLQVTGIVNKNVILFRDSFKSAYQLGISNDYAGLDGVVKYIEQQLAGSFRHVTEVFCIGTSSGGLPAIYCGDLVNAKVVWGFGARVCKATSVSERDAALRNVFRTALGRESPFTLGPKSLSANEAERVQEEMNRPEIRHRIWCVTEDPTQILDQPLLRRLVESKRQSSSDTRLHLYYSPKNHADTFVAESFSGIRNVALHAVEDAIGVDNSNQNTHAVVKLLDDQGRLADVFRDYV